jgi:tetratricopeptide (TPR) repeat protein
MRRTASVLTAVVLGLVLFLVAGVGLSGPGAQEPGSRGGPPTGAMARLGGGELTAQVDALQAHLAVQPRDARSWAGLGAAYVEQARITGDPSYYPRAEESLARALELSPQDDAALTGQAALAAARHDFAAALALADGALAVNPASARAENIRTDALVELGRYDQAWESARRADGLEPGLATFARLAYLHELHGDLALATDLLRRASTSATSAADRAFVHHLLGDLERRSGHSAAAEAQYDTALRADPGYVPALVGTATLSAASGSYGKALVIYAQVVERQPTVEHLVAYGELLEHAGRPLEAQQQYTIARSAADLARAAGSGVNLEVALLEADHGHPDAAMAAARQEWARRQSVHTADALAWALHAAGRDADALPLARAATRLGTADPLLLFHRGAIEHAVGDAEAARRSLRAALEADPGFSPVRAEQARALLAAMSGR